MLDPGVDGLVEVASNGSEIEVEGAVVGVFEKSGEGIPNNGLGKEESADILGFLKWPARAFRNGNVTETVVPLPTPSEDIIIWP